MSQLTEFLYPDLPDRHRPALSVVRWWESRRPAFNLVVGGAGLVTIAVMTLLLALPPYGTFAVIPWQPVVAYAVLANVCFTLGPVVELALRRLCGDRLLPVGPLLFRQGLVFSVGLTLLPTILAGAYWALRVASLLLG